MQGPPTYLPNAQLKNGRAKSPTLIPNPKSNPHGLWLGACRAELQREARHYAARPEPVTCGRVDAEAPWLDEPWRAAAGDERAARTDEERIRVEASWGRWLWLVAELTPTGALKSHPDGAVSSEHPLRTAGHPVTYRHREYALSTYASVSELLSLALEHSTV